MEKSTTPIEGQPIKEKRSFFGSLIVGAVGTLSLLYLTYPSLGIFELIPDAVPVVGHIDETVAVTMLISSLAYFGIDLGSLFGRTKSEPKQAKGEVVD